MSWVVSNWFLATRHHIQGRLGMSSKWKMIGKFALEIAKATIPGVQQVEAGVQAFRQKPTGGEKRDAVKQIVLGGLTGVEFAVDRDLLQDPVVAAAWDEFISSYVGFQNALATAKSARVPKTPGTPGDPSPSLPPAS